MERARRKIEGDYRKKGYYDGRVKAEDEQV
jgi:hypothetical protein